MPGADDRCDLSDAEWNDVMRGLEPSESTAEFQARQQAMAEEKAKLVALLQAERRALASSPASSTDVAGLAERLRERRSAFRKHGHIYTVRDAALDTKIIEVLERLTFQPSPPPTGSEREKIVAWLRENAAALRRQASNRYQPLRAAAEAEAFADRDEKTADAIARGDHLNRSEQ